MFLSVHSAGEIVSCIFVKSYSSPAKASHIFFLRMALYNASETRHYVKSKHWDTT